MVASKAKNLTTGNFIAGIVIILIASFVIIQFVNKM